MTPVFKLLSDYLVFFLLEKHFSTKWPVLVSIKDELGHSTPLKHRRTSADPTERSILQTKPPERFLTAS